LNAKYLGHFAFLVYINNFIVNLTYLYLFIVRLIMWSFTFLIIRLHCNM